MPTSGSGTGTRITSAPSSSADFTTWPVGALTLAKYAQIIGYTEAAFFGVAKSGDPDYACRDIWTKENRDELARYLYEAQQDIEQFIGYPLQPRWFVEDYPAKPLFMTKQGKVLAVGARAVTVIEASAAVDHTNDPAEIGPLTVAFTDTSEVKVYYPGTDQEIEPSKVTISGTSLTIHIPRVRMVAAGSLENPATGLDYADTDNFQDAVDVKRVYHDTTTQATVTFQKFTESVGFSTTSYDASAALEDAEIGRVRARLIEDVSEGSPIKLTLSYRAGLETVTRAAEDVILRLAHARMPALPTGCENVLAHWRRDRWTPQVATRERYNNPWGLTDGAWYAWTHVQDMRLIRVGIY